MGIIRKTKSVDTLLHIFERSNTAISVVELVDLLHHKMNKTTVYRILERLEDEGTLHCFMGKDGLKWYARCNGCSSSRHMDSHPHFQCMTCGKTECLTMDIAIPAIANRKIDSVALLLTGSCEDCLS